MSSLVPYSTPIPPSSTPAATNPLVHTGHNSSSSASPHKPTTIDHTALPLIIDSIFKYCPRESLLAARTACKERDEKATAILAQHIHYHRLNGQSMVIRCFDRDVPLVSESQRKMILPARASYSPSAFGVAAARIAPLVKTVDLGAYIEYDLGSPTWLSSLPNVGTIRGPSYGELPRLPECDVYVTRFGIPTFNTRISTHPIPIRKGGRIVLSPMVRSFNKTHFTSALVQFRDTPLEIVVILNPSPTSTRHNGHMNYNLSQFQVSRDRECFAKLAKELGTGLGEFEDLNKAPKITSVNMCSWMWIRSDHIDAYDFLVKQFKHAASLYPTTADQKMNNVSLEILDAYIQGVGHRQFALETEY